MLFKKFAILLLIFLTYISCKNYYNDAIDWSDGLKKGTNSKEIKKLQPNYLKIDWENPIKVNQEKWYLITEIKGSKDILGMQHFLVFLNDKYQYRESKK